MKRKILLLIVLTALGACLIACRAQPVISPIPTAPPLAEELIFYDWAEDMPQSVLDAFTEEYGVQVAYVTYESQEEAMDNIKAGEVYDVVVMDNDAVPLLLADNLLAEIDYRNVPNFDNISLNFRDLAYDPGNKHSVPFNWGTTGLVVRSDLVEKLPTHWSSLWDPCYAGKIALREGVPYDFIGLTLKSLGFSINSEDPGELEVALKRMLQLKESAIFVGSYAEDAVPVLLSGEAVILVGWAEDVLLAREYSDDIVYILPEEGTLLWGDNFVIPANSPRKYTAEVFLNFLLRPEISAQITNENYYATPNEAARPFIEPDILNDPVVFPSNDALANAEVFLPRSVEGAKLWDEIWERFMAGGA
ncbi:MAG: spermidine/putrescine ABC transporter substrate-binding protein [Anaerolineae bacterium]|nr:spermidine/putrescine ABC transporter substrate-binding protein [Anaerolineae bacterium]